MFKPKENIQNLTIKELETYFDDLFNTMALKHNHYNVFENFLDCAINGFSFNYDQDRMESIRKRYSQDERYVFGEMIGIWILLADRHIKNDSTFYDFFGSFYEKQSLSKQKGFAQFFTPEEICRLITSLVMDIDNKDGQSIHEPTCGSGRLNLAAHVVNPNMFHYANDLDFTCAKMAALNFMMHGIKGVVICDCILNPTTRFQGAFIINDLLVPSIRFLMDIGYVYKYVAAKVRSRNNDANVAEAIESSKGDDVELVKRVYRKTTFGDQLTLFE